MKTIIIIIIIIYTNDTDNYNDTYSNKNNNDNGSDYNLSQSELKSIYWVRFELLCRDFYRFIAIKFGNSIFKYKGPMNKEWLCSKRSKEEEMTLFEKWKNGETGYPIIDASMKELGLAGYLSNRLRQNVASFLIHDLLVDWRYGAEYFESILIDCDCWNNYGNWNYIAGIGCDPRQNRYFNILGQAKRYDKNGNYVKLWLNPLFDKFDKFDGNNCNRNHRKDNKNCIFLHQPWEMSGDKQSEYGIILGKNYPSRVVQLKGHSAFDTSHTRMASNSTENKDNVAHNSDNGDSQHISQTSVH